MIANTLKVLAAEATVSTASDFSGKPLIRVYNHNGADVLLTVTSAATGAVSTITIRTGETLYIQKAPADTLGAATGCKMVPVAF